MKISVLPETQFLSVTSPVPESEIDAGRYQQTGVAPSPDYDWRQKHGVLYPSDAIRLCQLEKENLMLKRVLANLNFELALAKYSTSQTS